MNSLTPEQRLERRLLQSRQAKAAGRKPVVRGGNGTGPTAAEKALMNLIPELSWNYPVATKQKPGSGYPTCYKLDLAIPSIKLGVEADGNTHGCVERRMQDEKKTKFLAGLGWTVLRFKNKRILETPEVVAAELSSIISRLKDTRPIPQTDS